MVNMTGTHQAVPVEHLANHLSASLWGLGREGADDFLDLFMYSYEERSRSNLLP